MGACPEIFNVLQRQQSRSTKPERQNYKMVWWDVEWQFVWSDMGKDNLLDLGEQTVTLMSNVKTTAENIMILWL